MANDRFDLRSALDELRSTGQMSAAVRPEIAASWQRSIASDLQPDRLEVPYGPDAHTDDRLERAAFVLQAVAGTHLADHHNHRNKGRSAGIPVTT